ncbi:Uncharacterised protein [Moraxella atlantae]|uniref:Uncharacterized protein n=1 Tax=Faucicola atlantae TaxID=34059 RepID=A0A378Q0I8_9GAMM|nr:Uncharacterised protein [Moraxella atlantae]
MNYYLINKINIKLNETIFSFRNSKIYKIQDRKVVVKNGSFFVP